MFFHRSKTLIFLHSPVGINIRFRDDAACPVQEANRGGTRGRRRRCSPRDLHRERGGFGPCGSPFLRVRQARGPPAPAQEHREEEGGGDRRAVQASLRGLHRRRRRAAWRAGRRRRAEEHAVERESQAAGGGQRASAAAGGAPRAVPHQEERHRGLTDIEGLRPGLQALPHLQHARLQQPLLPCTQDLGHDRAQLHPEHPSQAPEEGDREADTCAQAAHREEGLQRVQRLARPHQERGQGDRAAGHRPGFLRPAK
ncbi:unnamed protein product, partial [Musa hybrid cultivar]